MDAKKNESALEAENARLRGDLLTVSSRVSHDLRTPLGGMVTAAEVLREILAEKNLPANLAQAILDSVDDLTRLIKQISFVTRATAQPIPKTPLHMSEIVGLVLQRLERKMAKKNLTVVKPESWPQVNGVATWLDMIWWNLLLNETRHTPDNTHVELQWREENGFYRFEVSDNGPGVAEHIRPGLFQSFDTLHQPGGAKGLGLSIVQRLVSLQGGQCGYEMRPAGPSFFFSLPVK